MGKTGHFSNICFANTKHVHVFLSCLLIKRFNKKRTKINSQEPLK